MYMKIFIIQPQQPPPTFCLLLIYEICNSLVPVFYGYLFIYCIICSAILLKLSSIIYVSLAEVSKNSTLYESANYFPYS